ncbi:MAG TPA: ribonuclease J [Candidatus Saccharimonadia bacterium]|nr:ribonuclease J [Candidatus Saccharimonadia bacterium]
MNDKQKNLMPKPGGMKTNRGAAIRAQQRNQGEAQRVIDQYEKAPIDKTVRANQLDDSPRLKITALGGMDAGGSKNMIVIEYLNDAVVIDCGNDLSVDLPGINYAICDTSYLETIKNKLRAYIMTHGHLDHIGGLPHIVPNFPAPIYGSKFTIGMVTKHFETFGQPLPEGFELRTVVMNEETHERLKIGEFYVELVRITHSIPGSTCVVLDSPVGRIICTGDYRLDPNPLDHEKSDTNRLIELGNQGVLALLNECLCADRLGRTPSESTIEPTFKDLFQHAPGRVFVGLFSTNINRIQMLVNAAVAHNRKIAMDGRSMMSTLEVAVRLGMIKVPKGSFVPIASVPKMKDQEIVIVSTGCQGEPNSALQRMSTGDHKYIKLKERDTVILSSTPIPDSGNDRLITKMVDELNRQGVFVKRHPTHEIDGCGPLHVSGHCSQDEYMEMITMVKPKFLIPIYGTFTAQKYHNEAAIERGFTRQNTTYINNGHTISLTKDKMETISEVPTGTVLVDQTGSIVSTVVIKDRLLLAEEGLVAIVLTVDKKRGQILTSPDIISRGFIYMRDNEELMKELREELRRAVIQRFKRVDLDRFKQEIREHVTHFLFEKTGRSPIIIPVVNVIGARNDARPNNNPDTTSQSVQDEHISQQKRFEEMRLRLLSQDARTD